MKTNKLFFLAAAAMLFANCAREEIDVTFKTGTAVAVMETEDTKSNVTDQGYFTWTAGDKIAIHTNSGILEGTLSEGFGTPNGTFSYTYTGTPEFTGYAMYPHSDNHSITGETLTFHMPATYELDNLISNTNAPMLARPSGEKGATASYNFSHLGGVIRVVFNNAPAGTDKFTLSLGGSKINGEFEVDLNADVPQIATTESETDNLTTLTFDALKTVQNITLFVPVPTGKYTGIEAKLYAGEKLLGTWGNDAAVNDIARRALVLMAPITFASAGGNIENDQQVSSAGELAAAVANGGTITITEGINLGQAVVIPAEKEVVLNLNGNTINAASPITVSEGATLSLVNNGQPVQVKSGESSVSGGIVSDNDIIVASKGATINIGENVSLYSTENCAVFIPSGAEGVTLNTAGDLKAGGQYSAIYVNGKVKTGTINITGGSISHEKDVAVYVAGNANVTVSEGVAITGTTAMEVRAGKLTVNGGKFVATANQSEYVPNGNGSTSKGVALAMCKHSTTENSLIVEINGGEFTGAKSLLVNTDLGPVSLQVNGGTFSDPTACNYLGANADVTVKLTADYTGPGFKVKSDQKISLDLGNNTYTVTAPLVGSAGTETNGFQFLSGSTINISNGTITSSVAKLLVQNYTNLNLDNVTLNPTVESLEYMKGSSGKVQPYYVLSNNSGTVNINGNTTIKAPVLEGLTSYAFDVCKFGKYVEPHVIWNSTGKVDGDIELSGGKFELNSDLELTGVIKVTGTSEVVLNEYDITSGGDVFDVTGKLTVSGSDEAKVTAKSGAGSTCAVWVHKNGTAIINGGHYSVGADKNGLRNDCIYVNVGNISIKGGKFEYTGDRNTANDYNGDQFLLNCRDNTNSKITVSGGSFKNHVPGAEAVAPDGAAPEVVVAEGKKVYNGETEVNAAHTGDTDVWYTVK